MSEIETGGPAFPRTYSGDGHNGMTLRKYAAIKLRVPNSGDDWLDDMITDSLRNDFAAKAMHGFLTGFYSEQANKSPEACADWAYEQADAMMVAGSKA